MPKEITSRFQELDAKVKRCLTEAGAALEEIKDKKLYREVGMHSFKEYCESIGRSYQWAWLQIEAGKVAKMLPEIKSEATAREVRKVAVPKRRGVVEEALKQSGGILSAPAIKNAAMPPRRQPSAPIKQPECPRDGTGIDIPPEIQDFWKRNEEVRHLLSLLSKIRVTLEKAQESHDRLFRKIDLQGSIAKLLMIKEEVECAESFAVCPECSGVIFENCERCSGRGSLSKFHWSMVPEEIKKLRESNP